ncbi:hypothetical protein STRIP9103_08221 [Streptomyces ipomoeae 91-03]|uniref:Uncharacterized protein n=1 Tax=Streptomyces ipomoeae 91-03 TaxID=698759 RepID=L1L8N0_9ACTN|nr:hypothetical protein STRIP9103_08221 [Streptomyces ipomoeae 91-03]
MSAFAAGHTPDPTVFYRQAEGTRRVIKAFGGSGCRLPSVRRRCGQPLRQARRPDARRRAFPALVFRR